jgi:transposase
MSTVAKLSKENSRVRIVTLQEEGLSFKKIGIKTGKRYQTVSRICKRVKETKSFKDKPRSGRPKLLDDRKKRVIARILCKSKVKTAESIRKEA